MGRPLRMEELEHEPDGRHRSPSANRNRAEILPLLARALRDARTVLEIASGTGEHAVYFARELPDLIWLPTERDPGSLDSIRAWRVQAGSGNLLEPIALDVETGPWPIRTVDAVVAINFLHIVPWSACCALLAGAGRTLAEGGTLFLYGALFRAGHEAAPSNLAFDEQLRTIDPAFGVRSLEDVLRVARGHGLYLEAVEDVPNHNAVVVLRRG